MDQPRSSPEFPPPYLEPRRQRPTIRLVIVLLVLAAIGTVVVLLTRDKEQPPPAPPRFVVPALHPEPNSVIPRAGLPAPPDRPDVSDQAELEQWAARIAQIIQIPARPVVSYGKAEMVMRQRRPGCHISWATVAGVGRVESKHGRINGAEIGPDGQASKPIIGPELNGSDGLRAVPDTDNGKLDGDPQWDRAVGPMQFLPATWRKWALRAADDGAEPDPQNIDDAALSAANYLCASGGDLGAPTGWWTALNTYNQSVSYGQDVFSGADAYAAAVPPA